MKTATSIEEQIELLKQRGITITDEEKAKEQLLDIGYYRLGFYLFPFEKSYPKLTRRDHSFKQGAQFCDAVDLYYFDVDLRNILLKYTGRFEVALRTYIIYAISNKHKNSPTWFVDLNVMQKNFISGFDKEIYDSIRKNPPICRHHQEYINDKYAPAWKTIEFMTLGNVGKIYHNLKDLQDRQTISKHFGVNQTKVFDNYLETIRHLRNKCAHGNVLYDAIIPKGIKSGPAGKVTNDNYESLGAAINVLKYFIGIISSNRKRDLENELNAVLDRMDKRNPKLLKLILKTSNISYSSKK